MDGKCDTSHSQNTSNIVFIPLKKEIKTKTNCLSKYRKVNNNINLNMIMDFIRFFYFTRFILF